ncbi:phosphotransferase [Streptomyces rameus]
METHGDFQLRNLPRTDDGSAAVIDFERSEPGPAVRDLVRARRRVGRAHTTRLPDRSRRGEETQ